MFVCGLYFFLSYSTCVSISDFKETIMHFRVFSLGERFRDLEESLATSDTQHRKVGYLLFLVIRNALERGIFFLHYFYRDLKV